MVWPQMMIRDATAHLLTCRFRNRKRMNKQIYRSIDIDTYFHIFPSVMRVHSVHVLVPVPLSLNYGPLYYYEGIFISRECLHIYGGLVFARVLLLVAFFVSFELKNTQLNFI